VRDLAALSERIFQPELRLLTIIGPPGIGKTRLAIAVAGRQMDRFRGGVWFVDLSVVTRAESILPAIARPLNVAEPPGQSLIQPIAEQLHN